MWQNYELALLGFRSAIKAKNNHLFGHYFCYAVYIRFNDIEAAAHHKKLTLAAAEDEYWQKWLIEFPDFHKLIKQLQEESVLNA